MLLQRRGKVLCFGMRMKESPALERDQGRSTREEKEGLVSAPLTITPLRSRGALSTDGPAADHRGR